MKPRPPALARWLAERLLRADAREVVIGDLEEGFARRMASGVPAPLARRAYWRESLDSIAAVRFNRHAKGDPVTTTRLLQGFSLDLRHVLRGLAASRGFTAVAVLSLAVGIGATAALGNVARTLLVTELPVDRPGELFWVLWSSDLKMRTTNFGNDDIKVEGRSYNSNYSYPLYRAVKTAVADRAEISGFNVVRRLNVTRASQPAVAATGLIVTGDFFATLRLPLAMGRGIGEADDADGVARVAVISHGFWRQMFGGDVSALGAILSINGTPFEIVGVTSPAFNGLSRGGLVPPTDVFVPLAAHPAIAPSWKGPAVPLNDDFSRQWIRIVARVRESAEAAGLAGPVTTVLRQALAGVVPANADLRATDARLFPANRGLDSLSSANAQPLRILAAVVGVFLVVTCANLAGMITARNLARRRELAVRRALGAGRWRLVRQSLIESLVLATIAGAAGTLLAAWSGPALTLMLSDGLSATDVRIPTDWSFVALAAAVTFATAIAFGIVPALRLTGMESTADLRDRTVAGGGSQRAGRVLIAFQLAVSVPLLVGALLLLQTLRNFSSVDLGFDPRGLVSFEINQVRRTPVFDRAPLAPDDARRIEAIVAKLETIPGVASATVLENGLIAGWTSNTEVWLDGQRARFQMQAVGPRFFETMRMPLVAGRSITTTDVAGAPDVAVVNEAAARAYFRESPIGRTFSVGIVGNAQSRLVQVIGVVADARYGSLRQAPQPTFYDAVLQRPGGIYRTVFAVRSSVPAAALTRPLREAVALVDPDLPIATVESEQATIARTVGRERVLSRLLTLFAGFALLLTSLGLHGLTSYFVQRRTSEIGIRLALGAQRTQVVWLVLRQVLVVASIGVALGLPLALAGGPLVASYLFGVAPRDGISLLVSAGVLTVVALAAGWLPARRAARMDPLDALRVE